MGFFLVWGMGWPFFGVVVRPQGPLELYGPAGAPLWYMLGVLCLYMAGLGHGCVWKTADQGIGK